MCIQSNSRLKIHSQDILAPSDSDSNILETIEKANLFYFSNNHCSKLTGFEGVNFNTWENLIDVGMIFNVVSIAASITDCICYV